MSRLDDAKDLFDECIKQINGMGYNIEVSGEDNEGNEYYHNIDFSDEVQFHTNGRNSEIRGIIE